MTAMNHLNDLDCPYCTCPLPMGLEAGDEVACDDCGGHVTIDWCDYRPGLHAYRDPDSWDDPSLAASGGMRGSDAEEEMRERARAARRLK